MYNSLPLTVRKWGNSLGIRISKPVAELMDLGEGDELMLILRDDRAELIRKDDLNTYRMRRERDEWFDLQVRNSFIEMRRDHEPFQGRYQVSEDAVSDDTVSVDGEEIVEADEVIEDDYSDNDADHSVREQQGNNRRRNRPQGKENRGKKQQGKKKQGMKKRGMKQRESDDPRAAPAQPQEPEDILEDAGNQLGIRLPRPDYSAKRRGRTTPAKVTDATFEDAVENYPVLVVMFIDYLYLDFYDAITRELSLMEELCRLYKGKIWFAIAEEGKNTRARKRYIGNAWSEKEIRVFINGQMVMKGISLGGVMKQLDHIFDPDELKKMRSAHEQNMPRTVTVRSVDDVILPDESQITVLALFETGNHKAKRQYLSMVARHQSSRTDGPDQMTSPSFGICYDAMLFNKDTRTFYPNPIFERYEVSAAPSILLFKGEKLVARYGPDMKWKEIEQAIDGMT